MYCRSPMQMAPTQERCPVCRLFLLPDMLLSEHLDTHPKDQVILALTNLVEKSRSSRSPSPWMAVTKTSTLINNSALSSETSRSEWVDTYPRPQSWAKLQEDSWPSPNSRSTVLTSSPRNVYWQQNSPYQSDIRSSTSFNYSCATRNDMSNNSYQLIKQMSNKHDNTQRNSVSTSIPVIQRVDHLKSNIPEDKPMSGSSCIYRHSNYLEHQNGYDKLSNDTMNNVSELQIHPSDKALVSETMINNEFNRLENITITPNEQLRRDVIIQPINPRPTVTDPLWVAKDNVIHNSSLQNNDAQKIVKTNTVSTNAPYITKEIQPKLTKESKSEIVCKQNIEILSHSVIDNTKFFKNPEIKSLIIKQKKIRHVSQVDATEITGINDETESNSIRINNDDFQRWKDFNHEDSEEKILNNELNDEKSSDTNSIQDAIYDSEQRKTMFSPNLVIINLETNNEKQDLPKKLLDIDIYQQSVDDSECSKDLKVENHLSYSEKLERDKYEELTCKMNNTDSYRDQSSFYQKDVPLEEFSSHSGSKLNSSDNFRQNLDYSLSSESLNIRTDEKMPARGELSEQESTDSSSWAYQNACSSFPLNLPADENELNLSQYLTPMLEPSSSCSVVNHIDGSKSSKSSSTMKQHNIFKCAHCSEEFVCAKERRVHVSRCHQTLTTPVFLKEHAESVRNPFEFSGDYYMQNSTNQNDENNITDKERSDSQTKCDNFDSSLLVSSMNIINNTDAILEPLEDMHVEIKNADIKTDFNLFNINQSENFTDMNVKIEDNLPAQGKTKRIIKKIKIKRSTVVIYTCIICQEEFRTVNSFNVHLKKHPLECRTCAKLFIKKKAFDDHEMTHMGSLKKHGCTNCSKRFYSEQRLKNHVCKPPVNQIVKCSLCDAKFQRRRALIQHKIAMHKIKASEKIYFCHCGENFPSFAKLFYHKETHDTKPKNCKYCTQKFIHLVSLNRHIRTTHNDKTIENSEMCQICNKSLSKHSIRSHMKIHTGNAVYNCFICNKNFSTKWNLKQHKYVHQNRSTKPHKCQICPSAFIRLQDFKYHMNSHKKIYSFVCNQCGRKFIRKYNYLRHVKEHSQEKRYQCTVAGCTKVFHRKYYLTEHMRTHTGMRPFVCTICSKTSSTKSNHNKHLKIHHANARDTINVEN